MELAPEEEAAGECTALFLERREEIERLIPGAKVEHIGATSVPGSLTKGDLDLLVGRFDGPS